MSDKVSFEDVRLIIGESNLEVRQGLRAALHPMGFKNIQDTNRVSVIEEQVKENAVDLIICDASLGDGDLLDLTRRIRHREVGANPFIVVIATTSDPVRETIMAIIDCGADDLVAKPVSPAMLMQRIARLTRDRQRLFVVTTSYIGPDRRKERRPNTEWIPQIDVPNLLKAKALEHRDALDLQIAIDMASAEINERKMERHAVQIVYLVERIGPAYLMGSAEEREVVPMLDRLLYVSEDLSRRLQGSRFDHAADLCHAMVALAGRIRAKPTEPDSKDIRLLPELTQAIQRAFHPSGDTQAARDISATVRGAGRTIGS